MTYNIDNVTPRPFANEGGRIRNAEGPVAFCAGMHPQSTDTAAHIVHCVNNHEALVAALEELEAAADMHEVPSDAALAQARAALAAAKGENP